MTHTSCLWALGDSRVPSTGRTGVQTLDSWAVGHLSREARPSQGPYREQYGTVLSCSATVWAMIHELSLDERLVRIRKCQVQSQASFTSSKPFSHQTTIVAVPVCIRTHMCVYIQFFNCCSVSLTTPAKEIWAVGIPRNLRLEGQADSPRRCWVPAAAMGLAKPSGQVRRYRCMCWGHLWGQKTDVVNFLALVKDQKLYRQEQLQK